MLMSAAFATRKVMAPWRSFGQGLLEGDGGDGVRRADPRVARDAVEAAAEAAGGGADFNSVNPSGVAVIDHAEGKQQVATLKRFG